MEKSETTITRMAPSPTGPFHVGGMRTLIFNYLFAKHNNGLFKLRIEDTDKERSRREFEDQLKEAINWINIEWDDFMRQSDELSFHQDYIKKLLDNGSAYLAEESKEGDGQVIRFRNPNKKITINDLILGDVSFDTTDLGDFIIARNFESPLYHLTVVIDDHRMGVNYVIRAQEHLANTPRQILLIEALGFSVPNYAHIPFILGPDGKKKLSKRDGDVNILDYREKGYLPEAMFNFLSFIGFNPGGEKEVYTKEELIKVFDIKKVQKGPAGFNIIKLNWLNKQHLDFLSDEEWLEKSKDFWAGGDWDKELQKRMTPVIRERINFFDQLKNQIELGEYDYLKNRPILDSNKIGFKDQSLDSVKNNLGKVIDFLIEVGKENNYLKSDFIKEKLMTFADDAVYGGRGNILWPTRYALSGMEKSVDPFSLIAILGISESVDRLKKVLDN